jgi:transposase
MSGNCTESESEPIFHAGSQLESNRLKARLGAALIERDLLNEKIALLEADRPFARRRRKP